MPLGLLVTATASTADALDLGAAPSHATSRTPGRATHGPAIGVLAGAMGRPLMPWQRHVADVSTETLPDGSWAYPIVVVTVPRQSGKTTLLTPTWCERCMTNPDALTWHTAQTRQDARDSFLEAVKLLARSPLRPPRVKVRRSNGSEGFEFPNGASWRVFAPTEDALHGKANALVGVDEAWAQRGVKGLELEQAILPTFTTTGGQLWIVSTAGTAESVWLRGYVERGRAAVAAGRREGLAYFEWSLPADQVAEVTRGLEHREDDPAAYERALDLVLAAHPGYGYTLKLSALRQAADVMTPGEFLRAYANVWTQAAERIIPATAWDACRVPAESWVRPDGPIALGFDVSLDRADGAIVAAWEADGRRYVDVIEVGHPGRIPARLMDLVREHRPTAITYPPQGPADDVADQAVRLGVPITPERGLTTRDYATACQAALGGIVSGRWAHLGGDALDDATAAAATRTLGDGWAFSRRHSAASIAPLGAAAAASWALDHAEPPKPAPVVVVRRPPAPSPVGVVHRRR